MQRSTSRFQGNKQKEGQKMQTKLYVGNLGFNVTNEDLKTLFSNHGEVTESKLIEGKGFGFVEMSNQAEAESAKKMLILKSSRSLLKRYRNQSSL